MDFPSPYGSLNEQAIYDLGYSSGLKVRARNEITRPEGRDLPDRCDAFSTYRSGFLDAVNANGPRHLTSTTTTAAVAVEGADSCPVGGEIPTGSRPVAPSGEPHRSAQDSPADVVTGGPERTHGGDAEPTATQLISKPLDFTPTAKERP